MARTDDRAVSGGLRRLIEIAGRRSGWLIGALGLVAWLALLYFMVGDVL